MRDPLRVALALGLLGCGPVVELSSDEQGTTGNADSSSGGSPPSWTSGVATSGPPGTTSSPDETTSNPTGEGSTSDDGNESVCGLPEGCTSDSAGVAIECDVWKQDCQRGHKCMPWAINGGDAWNGTRCTPIAVDPDPVGSPCTVADSPTSGIDSCELGAVCWDVDPETLEGICVGQCGGYRGRPVCPEPLDCSVTHDGVLTLCLPLCDPLGDDCDEGQACVEGPGGFVCVPGRDPPGAAHGEPCSGDETCQPGLLCVGAADVPGCTADTCCSSLCELDEPEPCPDAEQVCVEIENRIPNDGICMIPD